MDASAYDFSEGPPVPAEYVSLREVAGLGSRTIEAAERGMGNELYAVTARLDGKAVAMGRVNGDGGTVFQITDVAVHPDHQGRGLGMRVMEHLLGWLDDHAPDTSYVNCIANVPTFYEPLGFERCAPELVGMHLR